MKKITLLLMALIVGSVSWSQCAAGPDGQYPAGTITVDAGGAITGISTCNYSTEYSVIDGVVAGNDYEVTIQLAGVDLYVTVENSADNSVIGHGASPFTFTAPAGVTGLFLNWSEDAACTYVGSGCRVTTIQDLSAAVDSCPDVANFAASNITDGTADLTWDENGVSAVSYNVEVYATGESAANGDTAVFADAAVSGTSVMATGLAESTGYDAYIMTTCSGATTMSMLVGPEAFTTTAACADVSGVGSENLTISSADITFTPGTGNDSVLVEVYATGESAANGDTPVYTNAAATSPQTASGLADSTGYDAYVTGFCGATATAVQGPTSFTTPAAPPANDDFANATAIDCSAGTITGSTSAATLDEDDAPDGGGADLDAPNVWFSIDSSVDGASDVTLNLCGSTYDSSVLVYTGTSGNLTFVAGNDDNNAACGQCCQSLVTFPTDGTSTYYFTVEGYNVGSTGDFDMVVSCIPATPAPGNDDCGSAVALSENVPVVGTTVGATTSPGDAPTCDTFGSIADVWYSVAVTGGLSDLSVTTTLGTTSDQANVAVYDDCAALAANSLGCSDANGGETLDINNIADGTYYIRVWSDGNAPPVTNPGRIEGEFTIVVNTTLSTEDVSNPATFTYFPNPVQNTLTLKAQNTIENVAMYNMLGQEVLRATPNNVDSELDMSNLQDGTYFVKVTIANITKTIRVIKH